MTPPLAPEVFDLGTDTLATANTMEHIAENVEEFSHPAK